MKHTLVYIMGVSGSGKSTIARLLSQKTGLAYYDGDDFHPEENIAKMASGQALNDEDRAAWLAHIHAFAQTKLRVESLLIACSALKEKYRQVLSQNLHGAVEWIYLEGSFDLIMNRLKARKTHFMPPSLLQSQFNSLEVPEYARKISIEKEPEKIVSQIIQELSL